jgi:hypothetical protein
LLSLYYIFNYLPFDWFAELANTKAQPKTKLGGLISGAFRRFTRRGSSSGAGAGAKDLDAESKSNRK